MNFGFAINCEFAKVASSLKVKINCCCRQTHSGLKGSKKKACATNRAADKVLNVVHTGLLDQFDLRPPGRLVVLLEGRVIIGGKYEQRAKREKETKKKPAKTKAEKRAAKIAKKMQNK